MIQCLIVLGQMEERTTTTNYQAPFDQGFQGTVSRLNLVYFIYFCQIVVMKLNVIGEITYTIFGFKKLFIGSLTLVLHSPPEKVHSLVWGDPTMYWTTRLRHAWAEHQLKNWNWNQIWPNMYQLSKYSGQTMGHSRVSLCLGFKTSLRAKPLIWKWVWFVRIWNCRWNTF